MLNLYYTEKILGLQEVKVKNIRENENSYEIEVEQEKNVFVLVVVRGQTKYTTTVNNE